MKSIESVDQFRAEVLASPLPVLVDFWADWCAPCKAMMPMLEGLETEYAGRVAFVKVNAVEHPAIAQQYHVRSLPSLLLIRGGVVAGTISGMTGRVDLARALAPFAT